MYSDCRSRLLCPCIRHRHAAQSIHLARVQQLRCLRSPTLEGMSVAHSCMNIGEAATVPPRLPQQTRPADGTGGTRPRGSPHPQSHQGGTLMDEQHVRPCGCVQCMQPLLCVHGIKTCIGSPLRAQPAGHSARSPHSLGALPKVGLGAQGSKRPAYRSNNCMKDTTIVMGAWCALQAHLQARLPHGRQRGPCTPSAPWVSGRFLADSLVLPLYKPRDAEATC
jgi:hypothetical protein